MGSRRINLTKVTSDEVINDEQLRRYRADGFLAIPQFVVGDELTNLVAHVERFINAIVPAMPSEQVFYEDKSDLGTLKQIQHMGDHDEWFNELFTASRIRNIAEAVVGSPVVPKNMQYFNKPPLCGRPTPPHQDGHYFMLDPCEAVTIWLALDDVDEDNGCVRYVRGSHRHGLRPHGRTETLGFSQGITDYPTSHDSDQEVAVSGRSGDLLVHHAMTIHRADGNHSSTRTRRALGFIYYSENAREDMDAQAAYQRKLAEELKAAGKI